MMARAHGTQVPAPRGCEEELDTPANDLTPQDEDALNIYLAQIHTASRNIASPDEIEDRLEAAKVAVAKRRTVQAHRARSSSDPALTPRQGVRARSFTRIFLAATIVALIWTADLSTAAIAIGSATTSILISLLTAPRTKGRLRRRRDREQEHHHRRPWWQGELDEIAEEVETCKPGRYVRAFDVGFALLALLATAPASIAAAALLGLTEGRTVVRGERRVGAGAKDFTLLRFHVTRDQSGQPATWLDWVLTRSGIEQIPRLFNLLQGDLTLVGPKPEIPAIAVRYPRSSRWVFSHRPGLTGPVSSNSLKWSREGGVDVASYLANVVPTQAQVDRAFLRMPPALRAALLLRAAASLLCPPILSDLTTALRRDHLQGPRLMRWGTEPLGVQHPSRRGGAKPRGPADVQGVVRWSEYEGVLV